MLELGRLSRPVNVFAEIVLEKHANSTRFEKRLAAIENVVECWEVSGTVDYIARFVCGDLAVYEELTSDLIYDENLGVARIISHVALRPDPSLLGLSGIFAGAKASLKQATLMVAREFRAKT